MKREVGLKTVVECDWFFNVLRCKGIKLYLFLMMMGSGGMFGQENIFSESMYNGTGGASGNPISTHESNNRFNEDGLTYSGTGDMRTTNVSSGYTGASGTWNVLLNSGTATPETFIIDGINATSYTDIVLSFGVRKSTNAETGSNLTVSYSTTGSAGTFTTITWAILPTGTGTGSTWYLRNSTSIIPSDVTTIRFSGINNSSGFNIDDILLVGTISASTNTITTSALSGSPFCVTGSVGASVSIPFTSTGTFTAGNTYTAQLSNNVGSFAAPTNIGTLSSSGNSGSVAATIPAGTTSGTGYRIRVISTTPAATGTDNGTNLTITLASSAIAPTTTQNLPIGTNGNLLTATDTGATSRIWKYSTVSGGPYTTSTGITASTYTPNFPSSGTFYIVCESTFACGTITSNQVTVNVSTPTISLTATPTLFSYAEGQGPSTHQTVVVSGTSLADNIVINAPTNWEISTTAIFTTPLSTITLTKNASNAVANNNIHIRLKSGLAQGLYSGSLQVTSLNAVTQTANMNGEVTAAVAFINVEANTGSFPDIANGSNTPTSLQNTLFAARAIGTSEAKSFRIQNLGGATLNLSGLTLTGTNPGDFSISSPPPATVAAGATVTFEVSFSPNAVGQRNAIVNLPNTSSNASPFTFNVQGSGTNPEIGITGNGNNIPNGNTAISATDNTSIGAANANTANPTIASKTFVISNTGNAVLTVSNIILTGTDASQFSVSPTSASIAASSTATITVTFAPTSYGEKDAFLSITNNDATDGEGSYAFAVQGNAVSYVLCEVGGNQVLAIQNFDATTPTWNYTVGALAFYDFGGTSSDGFWGITTSGGGKSMASSINYNSITNNFLFLQDLQCESGDGCSNTTGTGILTFDAIDVSGKQNVEFSFDYDIFEFDTGDDVFYELFYDGVSQGEVQFIDGASNVTTEGTILVSIPNTVNSFYFILKIQQNGSDAAGFDNFKITHTQSSEKIWNGTAWSGDGLPPTPSQKVIIDGNLTLPYTIGATTYDTLEGCECQVNPGRNVTVGNLDGSVPATLNIQGIVENNGTITLNNNSSLVQHNDQAINTGQASIKRTTQPMYRYDYTYWSSPVQPDPTLFLIGRNPDDPDIPGLSPLTLFNKYFEWNAASQNWNGIPYGNQAMTAGRGYIVRAPQTYDVENTTGATPDHYDANFIGVPNNGIIRHPVSGSSDVDENQWNLLGNPYPSALDADAFLELNADENEILGGTLYFWTHNTTLAASGNGTYSYNSADYAAWNGAGSVDTKAATSVGDGILNTNAPAGNIAAGQSFFVKGISDATNAEAIFNNNMRITSNNNQFFRPAPTTPVENWQTTGKHRVWLNLTGPTKGFSQTLVGYIENATNDLDNRFDGESFGGNQVTFYSILENKNLVIQGRALPFDTHDEVPLGYKTTLNGMLTISIDHLDGLLEGQDIYLEDNLLNIVHDLKASAYNFTTVPGTFNERFVLRYLPAAELSNPDHAVANSLIVFQNNDLITIKSQIENLSEITLYDITGKIVFENKALSQKEYSINQVVLSHQVLIVKIIFENGVILNKKIVF